MSKYQSMTLNERLYVAGLLDAFDKAARDGDRVRMMELLVQVEISQSEAETTAGTILAHPTRYGRA